MKIARITNAVTRQILNSGCSYFICMKKATTSPDFREAIVKATQIFNGPRSTCATATVTTVSTSRMIQTTANTL